MPGPAIIRRLLRRWRHPALSFILVPPGGPEAARAAIRSCLNQSLREIEVIVAAGGIADGAAPAGSVRETAEALASRDSRVRVVDGGARAALEAARSRWALLMGGEDRIEHDGPAALIDSLRRSGSDLAVGGSRVLDGDWTAEPPGPAGRGLRLDDALGLLDAPVPGRLVARTSAWRRLADDALVDPRERAGAALGLLLAARRIDVVDVLVDSRAATEPLSRDRRLEALARTADRLPTLLDGAPGPVRDRVLGALLRDGLLPLALCAPTAGDGWIRSLRALASRLIPGAADPAWAMLPLLDRALLWTLARGPLDELWEVLGSRAEDTACLPLIPDARALTGLAADAPSWAASPACPRSCSPSGPSTCAWRPVPRASRGATRAPSSSRAGRACPVSIQRWPGRPGSSWSAGGPAREAPMTARAGGPPRAPSRSRRAAPPRPMRRPRTPGAATVPPASVPHWPWASRPRSERCCASR
ncbi:hypothetical protein [Actinomyces denticolens]|uniref:hypothetical protein n=1 Tax=Actinomyces denticolens TaxID=52767 RepID=UPI001FC90DDF|nr:hypothetical protein [Actinomyces denticolens]